MRNKSIAARLARMPIRWKLTVWSAFLLFVIVAAYNAAQTVFVERWMLKEEKDRITATMNDILNEFLEGEAAFDEAGIVRVRQYLNTVNQGDQLIRIVDEEGRTIAEVSNHLAVERMESVPPARAVIVRDGASDGPLLVLRSPLTIFEFSGTVEIVRSLHMLKQLQASHFRVMMLFSSIAVLACAFGGALLAGQLLKPLQSMAETIRRIRRDGWQERMQPSNEADEIHTLMVMFNKMMDQVEQSFEQQQQFVEDASHELRTPVAIIEGHLKLLQRWGKSDPQVLEESLKVAVQELERLKRLIQELLALTRTETGEADPRMEEGKPYELIGGLVHQVGVVYPDYSFDCRLAPSSPVRAAISDARLEQLLLILIDNAVNHSPPGSTITIHAETGKGRLRIEVIDQGAGIPAKDLPYVMDRFYRADKARSRERGGYGLGLAIARRLVDQYAGSIEIASTENVGTTVTLTFPLINDGNDIHSHL